MMTSDERLDEIRRRAEAAPLLDAVSADASRLFSTCTGGSESQYAYHSLVSQLVGMADCMADIPWLLDEVARLTADRDAAQAKVKRAEGLAERWQHEFMRYCLGPRAQDRVWMTCADELRAALEEPHE